MVCAFRLYLVCVHACALSAISVLVHGCTTQTTLYRLTTSHPILSILSVCSTSYRLSNYVPVHVYWLIEVMSVIQIIVITETKLLYNSAVKNRPFFHETQNTSNGSVSNGHHSLGFTLITSGCPYEPFGTAGSMQCGGESWRADVEASKPVSVVLSQFLHLESGRVCKSPSLCHRLCVCKDDSFCPVSSSLCVLTSVCVSLCLVCVC